MAPGALPGPYLSTIKDSLKERPKTMKSINTVTVSGNLTRDAELKATASGAQLITFSVAVNDRAKDSQGQWVDRPNYIDCTLWGNHVQNLAPHMTRGTRVCASGRLRQDSWEDRQTGQKRSKVGITVTDVEILRDRPGAATASHAQPAPTAQQLQQTARAVPAYGYEEADEDIPF